MKLTSLALDKLKKNYHFPKFVIVGGINTVVSYSVYFLLSQITTFRIAYLLAFIAGIIFSYFFNLIYVFETTHTFKKGGLFIFIYVTQFTLSFFALNFLVVIIEVNPLIAPLFVTLMIMPVTYLFTKIILNGDSKMTGFKRSKEMA